jgi:hypothetical protein
MKPPPDPSEEYHVFSMDSSTLNSLIADVYMMIQADNKLLDNLLAIRRMASIINNRILDFRAAVPYSTNVMERRKATNTLNSDLAKMSKLIIERIDESIQTLQTKYGLKNPLTHDSMDAQK